MLSWIASCCHGSPKKGPIGEEAGVMSCRPAMLRGCKAGLFIHPVFLSLHFVLAQLTINGKKNTITQPCGVKTKESTGTRETSDYHSWESFQFFLWLVWSLLRSERTVLKVKQSMLNLAILYLEVCLKNKPGNCTNINTSICTATLLENKNSL